MTEFEVDGLKITLPDGVVGRKFDNSETHGLSHCMKAVDIIIEAKDATIFMEFKYPDNPGAEEKRRDDYINNFLSGSIDRNLILKCRDTLLYEIFSGKFEMPIYYIVLIEGKGLEPKHLLRRTDSLKKNIPLLGPYGNKWKKTLIQECCVMNVAQWNKKYPNYPITYC
ncbi:transposase [Azospirillaceae bacterium]